MMQTWVDYIEALAARGVRLLNMKVTSRQHECSYFVHGQRLFKFYIFCQH